MHSPCFLSSRLWRRCFLCYSAGGGGEARAAQKAGKGVLSEDLERGAAGAEILHSEFWSFKFPLLLPKQNLRNSPMIITLKGFSVVFFFVRFLNFVQSAAHWQFTVAFSSFMIFPLSTSPKGGRKNALLLPFSSNWSALIECTLPTHPPVCVGGG